MIATFQGLTFRVISPSAFVLTSVRHDIVDDPTASVIVAFNGDKWWIHYKSQHHDVARPFKSRDAAIAMIASRQP